MQKILMLVDDEQLMLRAMIRHLQRAFPMDANNYALLAFDDAASALMIARANPQSVYFVITDGHMPGMDGMDFVRLLMQDLGGQVRFCYLCTNDEEFANEATVAFEAFSIRAQAVHGKLVMAKEWPDILERIRSFLLES